MPTMRGTVRDGQVYDEESGMSISDMLHGSEGRRVEITIKRVKKEVK